MRTADARRASRSDSPSACRPLPRRATAEPRAAAARAVVVVPPPPQRQGESARAHQAGGGATRTTSGGGGSERERRLRRRCDQERRGADSLHGSQGLVVGVAGTDYRLPIERGRVEHERGENSVIVTVPRGALFRPCPDPLPCTRRAVRGSSPRQFCPSAPRRDLLATWYLLCLLEDSSPYRHEYRVKYCAHTVV
jgi:hypothetical protein